MLKTKEKEKIGVPTAADMKTFAKRFSKDEWDILAAHQDFLDAFGYDLAKCRPLAEKILARYKRVSK